MTTKKELHVVWLKRDLRLEDNEAISNALDSGGQVLLLYVFEPLLMNDEHYSQRHWDFIKQSIVDLNKQLLPYNSKVLAVNSDIIAAINQLLSNYKINNIYSHQETGILVTYERDKSFKRFCKNNWINWHENINNGVQRGLKNRDHWKELCDTFFSMSPLDFNPNPNQLLPIEAVDQLERYFNVTDLATTMETPFQKGGRTTG